MASGYIIVNTQPTIYNDPVDGVVNGVLVKFRMTAYDELHEVRVPKLDAPTVKAAIESAVSQRDELAALGQPEE